MKLLIRFATAVLAVLVLLYGIVLAASESGEVLVLTTSDSRGATSDTRLWTVRYDGSQWLRSGSPGSGWYTRLLAQPRVTYRIGDEVRAATAVPNPAATPAINALMNEKYGRADDLIDWLFGRGDAIAIRLVTDAPASP